MVTDDGNEAGDASRSHIRAAAAARPRARRFSGCVEIAAWTHPDVPVGVVVVDDSGKVTKMAFDKAFRRVTTPSPADDVWTIGACVR